MRKRTILLAIFAILVVIMGAAIMLLFVSTPEAKSSKGTTSAVSVLDTGTAGDYGFVTFKYRGTGNVTSLSYLQPPKLNITIINDSQAVQSNSFDKFVVGLKKLEDYGYVVKVSSDQKLGNEIYIVPSGAIPSYILINLQQNTSNGTIIIIGHKDLVLSNGLKKLNWYSSLTPSQKSRIVVYDTTLDDFMEKGEISLNHEILYNSWMLKNSSVKYLNREGMDTAVVGLGTSPLSERSYIRLIYSLQDVEGIYDSQSIRKPPSVLIPVPKTIYQWEKADLQFNLGKTNGTAFFTVKKDGKAIRHEQLQRVTDENVFIKKLQFDEPGEYVLLVEDNSGIVASGLLHIKDLKISLKETHGFSYVFSVLVDGKPLENGEAYISLGNSQSKKKFFISEGLMVVSAQLDQGMNNFNIEIFGNTIHVPVENNQEPLLEFYLKYGIPGLAVVALVYFFARMTKRPIYSIRFGEGASYIRQEISLPLDRALECFKQIRVDMGIERSTIMPHEFTISLKRYLTNGADVTEGNVEEILKKLVKSGYLESHRDYYQLKGEGDVKFNALRRMIREKLIETGTKFKEAEGKFHIDSAEIGFSDQKFSKKAIIVLDDKAEMNSMLSKLSDPERAKLRLLQANDMLIFVTIDRLGEVI